MCFLFVSLQEFLVHYCTSPECCDNYNPEVCWRKVCYAIKVCLLRVLPSIPSASKWTKLGPCLDWFLALWLPHSLLQHIYGAAFGSLAVVLCTKAASGSVIAGATEAFTQDINWHAVAGSRMSNGKAFVDDRPNMVDVLMLVLKGCLPSTITQTSISNSSTNQKSFGKRVCQTSSQLASQQPARKRSSQPAIEPGS